MNSLSWLLYWANVCGNIGGSFGGIAILLGIALLPCTIAYIIVNYCASAEDKDAIKARPFTNKLWRQNLTLFLGFMVLYAFIPDKGTVYAIAASEVGERVVKTEAVQGVANEASKALQKWIKDRIDPPKTEKK